jgi:TolB-like protein/DNA-binding winged helix-turn-helix (wHTH) protein/Flp pilus assembly protein TadD
MSPDLVVLADNLELDRRAYQLRRSGKPVKLSRIPMELLLLLVERRGELVTREEIGERIWGKDVFVDQDNNINAAIRKLRQVLDDDPEEPKFIQTVTGRGYRFIAPASEPPTVTPSEEAGAEKPAQDAAFVDRRASSPPVARRRAGRLHPVFLATALILVVAAVVYFQWFRYHTHSQAAAGRLMLAVLPFENLTGDAGQDYFSDGLTEEMIAQLGNLDPQHLGVIARTSVMHYKGTAQKLDQIGGELGVQYVLEGSVRRSSDKVRITAQLIQVKDQSHVWARQYDRELSNLLAVQGEIAREVAREIPLRLVDAKAAVPASHALLGPQEYEAYDLYLKGRYFWNKRTPRGFQQAIECFQQAIAKDPTDARAYAGLADSYALLSGYTQTPQTESMPKARAAALKALELDEGLAEAHTSLALITENYDWDWKTAEKEYRRAIELNPNYATAHHWYAEFLSWQGRFDEAFAESERARQLDPLSLIIASDNAAILFYSRQYDRAIAQCRSVLEMEPNFPRAHLVVAAYAENGQLADALSDLEKWHDGQPEAWTWAWRAYIYGRAGQQVQARHALVKLQQLYRHQTIGPDPILWAYVGVGDRDQAFAWFEKAYADHSNLLTSLKVNPAYDALREDPRFQDLMRRVGLASN